MAQEPLDVRALRGDTPGCCVPDPARRVHLNNAGAALSPAPVVDAVAAHLRLEQEVGGYEAAAERSDAVEAVYSDIAKLINAEPAEIACAENATRAWDLAFYSLLHAQRGAADKALVFTTKTDYGSNSLALAQAARSSGVIVRVMDDGEDGTVDVGKLQMALAQASSSGTRVLCVCLCWIPTSSNVVQPAEGIGRVCEEAGIPYLVDACQAVGQVPVDVKDLRCDALSATGRKFLRGPRGIGLLYVRSGGAFDSVEPVFLDIRSASLDAGSQAMSYTVQKGARAFETWERPVALWLGLGAAARYATDVGICKIRARIIALAKRLQTGLQSIEGVSVADVRGGKLPPIPCGIVSFYPTHGLSPCALLKDALMYERFNVSVSGWSSTAVDFESRGLREVVRVSVHYYNTENEVDSFLLVLSGLAKDSFAN